MEMRMPEYRTSPLPIATMPPGIPYIVGNEAAERFSFYGMNAILAIYMTQYLMGPDGNPATMSETDATAAIHMFKAAAYLFPFLGAILADWLFGKYPVIIWLSLVYCLGHVALAVDRTAMGLMVGLSLIAIGAGGIKSCVSAHVGDQFSETNKHLVSRVFGWFYFSINFGSFFSTLLTPWLLNGFWQYFGPRLYPDAVNVDWEQVAYRYGPDVAFGVPAVLMFLATVVFWMGRHKFAHIPPGGRSFLAESFGPEGRSAIMRLLPVYAFVVVFWSLYDQSSSRWILQAERMDRRLMGIDWLSSQIPAINPILVMVFIPLFNYLMFPAFEKIGLRVKLLVRVLMGFLLVAISFAVVGLIEQHLVDGQELNIAWQLIAWVFLTAGEVLVYGTCLELSYTQAPNRMKSLIMAIFLLTVFLGNFFTSAVNFFIKNDDGTLKLDGANYYWFFTLLMLIASVLFVPVVVRFREVQYLQKAD